jgi:hypothetical protein
MPEKIATWQAVAQEAESSDLNLSTPPIDGQSQVAILTFSRKIRNNLQEQSEFARSQRVTVPRPARIGSNQDSAHVPSHAAVRVIHRFSYVRRRN